MSKWIAIALLVLGATQAVRMYGADPTRFQQLYQRWSAWKQPAAEGRPPSGSDTDTAATSTATPNHATLPVTAPVSVDVPPPRLDPNSAAAAK